MKVSKIGVALVPVMLSVCTGYSYSGDKPVIFNYHRYDPPVPFYVEEETAEQKAADPVLHAYRSSFQVHTMEEVRARYIERDWQIVESMPDRLGRGPLWGDFFRTIAIERGKESEVLIRFEYRSLKGDLLCYVFLMNKIKSGMSGNFLIWESGGWKKVQRGSIDFWGADVVKIRHAYEFPDGSKPLAEKDISVLVRKIRQEVLADK